MSKITIRELGTEEFGDLWLDHGKKFFEDQSQIFRLRDFFTDEEVSDRVRLQKNMGEPIRINLGLYEGDKFIGWSWGYQDSGLRFYMCNSAVFPEYRRKGYYSMLVEEMMKRVFDLGFQEIYSRHTMTNNAVIIPKLKKGFVISSIELTDTFGALVVLSYLKNPLRRKMLDYRVGQIKPDDEIRKSLNI